MHRLPRGFTDVVRQRELLDFGREVLRLCHGLGVRPLLDGSLAVVAHTGDESFEVRDIDLSCPESEFPRLAEALRQAGIFVELQPWHVLQARRGDVKVEFGATEVWMSDLNLEPVTLDLGEDLSVQMVDLATLIELYRRGFIATDNEDEEAKHAKIGVRLRALEATRAQLPG